jgi:hypothetical protein
MRHISELLTILQCCDSHLACGCLSFGRFTYVNVHWVRLCSECSIHRFRIEGVFSNKPEAVWSRDVDTVVGDSFGYLSGKSYFCLFHFHEVLHISGTFLPTSLPEGSSCGQLDCKLVTFLLQDGCGNSSVFLVREVAINVFSTTVLVVALAALDSIVTGLNSCCGDIPCITTVLC